MVKPKSLLFVHDHIFVTSNNNEVYSPGAFPESLWSKYLDHFDNLIVVGRNGGTESAPELSFAKSSADGVEFIFVEKISSLSLLFKNSIKLRRRIKALISEVDHVVVRLPSENGLIAAHYADKLGVSVCVEVVGCAWDSLWNYGGTLSKLYAPIRYYRMRKAVSKAGHVLYVTDSFLQNRYRANPNAKTVSASNVSISVDDIQTTLEKPSSYSKIPEHIVFGILGNYKTKYKGIHIAIEALSKVHFPVASFELRVLGNGNPGDYEKQISDLGLEGRVVFYSPVPSGDPVFRWLDEIDIYLQPSLTEGLPRSLIEAMSRGCVALGSAAGGIPELIEKRFIHEAGNASDLAATITQVLNSYSTLWLESERNIRFVKNYDYRAIEGRRSLFFKEFSACRQIEIS